MVSRAKQWIGLGLTVAYSLSFGVMTTSVTISTPVHAQVQSTDMVSQADTFFRLGVAAYQDQQLNDAIAAWQQALRLYRTANLIYHQSVVSNFLSAAHISLGQMDQANEYLTVALPLAQRVEDLALQGQILANLGIVYRRQGHYVSALESYKKALGLMRQLSDLSGEAHILGLLGNVHESLGEYQPALEYHRQSLALARNQQNWLSEATALVNLGAVQAGLGNYGQAIDHYQHSRQLSQTHNDVEGVVLALNNLGSAYHALGDLEQAIDYYQTSLTTVQKLNNPRLEGEVLGNLGAIHSSLSDFSQALEYLERSLAIATATNDPKAKAIALNNLGHTLYTSGQLELAATQLYDAINELESVRPGLNDQNTVSIFDTQVFTYNLLQQVLVAQDQPEEALEVAERGRARAFVELLASQSEDLEAVTKAPTIEQIRAIAKDQEATLVQYTLVPDDSFKFQGKQRGTASRLYIWVVQPTGQVDFREVDLKPLQEKGLSIAKLVETSRDRSGFRGTRGDIRSVIRPGDQVRREGEPLDWAPYEVIAVDPRAGTVTLSHLEIFLPNPAVPIHEVYKINSSAFATALRRPQHWQDLHQLLIEPIAGLLPTDPEARVVFIPQEQLFLVPFPALQTQDGSYLIEHHTILTAPAIQILALTNRPDSVSAAAAPLVVGNPSPMPERLQALPHAGTEAAGIADVLSTQPLIGKTATETAVKKQLAQASLIHLATHGFFNETHPLQGSLALVPADDQDGFLTAAEILDQSLQADLVVLSACDTGRGQITGDGVIGLSRSFLAAGAGNVMVSLWQVPDDATAQLMIEFYRQRQHLDNAQALRQAMLATRDKYADPVAWAAFTLIGSVR